MIGKKNLTDKLCTAIDDTNINDKDISPSPSDNAVFLYKGRRRNSLCGKEYYRYVYECP